MLVLAPARALAQEESTWSAPLMGLGGGLRGGSLGAASVEMNPGTMAADPRYSVDVSGGFQGGREVGGGRLSVVDALTNSSLAFGMALGVDWRPGEADSPAWFTVDENGEPTQALDTEGAAGLRYGALGVALPMMDRKLGLGATVKALSLHDGEIEPVREVTTDVGLFYRPIPRLGLGLVGNNLRQIEDPAYARTVAGGAVVMIAPGSFVAVDGVLKPVAGEASTGELHLGGQYVVNKEMPVQLGGILYLGEEALRGAISAGLGLASPQAGLYYAIKMEIDPTQSGEISSHLYHMLSLQFVML